MSKEYAALLAQVLPVVAVGLGLEIRSLTAQLRNDETKGGTWRRGWLSFLCWILAVISYAEFKALTVASALGTPTYQQAGKAAGGSASGGGGWLLILFLAIFVAFAGPAIAVIFGDGELNRTALRRRWATRENVISDVVLTVIAVSSFLAVVVQI